MNRARGAFEMVLAKHSSLSYSEWYERIFTLAIGRRLSSALAAAG